MNYLAMLCAVLLILSGCGAVQQADQEPAHQVLVKVSPLPVFASGPSPRDMNIRVAFRVLRDGTVADIRVLDSPADPGWNSAAVELMNHWRFSQAGESARPEGQWIQYSLVIHAEEPVVMTLGEISASTKDEADSLYKLLDSEFAFPWVPARASVDSSTGLARLLGPVDIAAYPQRVRDELRKLRIHHFTRPLRLGNSYVIYVRFEDQRPSTFVQ